MWCLSLNLSIRTRVSPLLPDLPRVGRDVIARSLVLRTLGDTRFGLGSWGGWRRWRESRKNWPMKSAQKKPSVNSRRRGSQGPVATTHPRWKRRLNEVQAQTQSGGQSSRTKSQRARGKSVGVEGAFFVGFPSLLQFARGAEPWHIFSR